MRKFYESVITGWIHLSTCLPIVISSILSYQVPWHYRMEGLLKWLIHEAERRFILPLPSVILNAFRFCYVMMLMLMSRMLISGQVNTFPDSAYLYVQYMCNVYTCNICIKILYAQRRELYVWEFTVLKLKYTSLQ